MSRKRQKPKRSGALFIRDQWKFFLRNTGLLTRTEVSAKKTFFYRSAV